MKESKEGNQLKKNKIKDNRMKEDEMLLVNILVDGTTKLELVQIMSLSYSITV